PTTVGPTGWSLNLSEVTAPKLAPAPRTAQKRSAFSSSLAVTTDPSASTISTPSRLSSARPYFPCSQPQPPPSVRPPTPVLETAPPVVASPCFCVASLNPSQVAPPPATATRRSGSTSTVLMRDRS